MNLYIIFIYIQLFHTIPCFASFWSVVLPIQEMTAFPGGFTETTITVWKVIHVPLSPTRKAELPNVRGGSQRPSVVDDGTNEGDTTTTYLHFSSCEVFVFLLVWVVV